MYAHGFIYRYIIYVYTDCGVFVYIYTALVRGFIRSGKRVDTLGYIGN